MRIELKGDLAMIKIMFVCHGNICRSPMAEFIFKKIVSERGGDFKIVSSATSREEIGNSVYPPAARVLTEHGISCKGKLAVQFTVEDYNYYDYIICMETYNIRNLVRMIGSDTQGKLCRLLDFTDNPRDVVDPWYSRDFETAYNDIYEGCLALYEHLSGE